MISMSLFLHFFISSGETSQNPINDRFYLLRSFLQEGYPLGLLDETQPLLGFCNASLIGYYSLCMIGYHLLLCFSDSVASHLHSHKSHTHRQYNEQFMVRAPDRYFHCHFHLHGVFLSDGNLCLYLYQKKNPSNQISIMLT